MDFTLDQLTLSVSPKPYEMEDLNGWLMEIYLAEVWLRINRRKTTISTLTIAKCAGKLPKGEEYVSMAKGRTIPDSYREFLFDSSGKAKPFISWRWTPEEFRGKGASTYLTERADSFYRSMFGMSLYSDIDLTETSKRLWQRLENQGKAGYCPLGSFDRWRML